MVAAHSLVVSTFGSNERLLTVDMHLAAHGWVVLFSVGLIKVVMFSLAYSMVLHAVECT